METCWRIDWFDLIVTLSLTVPSISGRNGQVHEAWEGGDGPSWTLRRAQSCHRQGKIEELLGVLLGG